MEEIYVREHSKETRREIREYVQTEGKKKGHNCVGVGVGGCGSVRVFCVS